MENASIPLPEKPPEQPSLGPGAGATDEGAALSETIKRASADAVGEHLSDPDIQRKRGQRGPDRRPRKARLPVSGLDNGPVPTPGEEAPPSPLSFGIPAEPSYDEETARALVEIAIGLLNDGASAVVRAVAKKETGDELLATEAAQEVRMGEKIETAVREGAIRCAKKYSVRLEYAPELMLGGGLLIWAGQVSLSVKTLKEKGAEIRERESKAKKAA